MAIASSEYGPVGVDSQVEPPQPDWAQLFSRRRTVAAVLALASGAALAMAALLPRGGSLRTSARGLPNDELIGLAQNDPFQCTWSWGEGLGSWEKVWSDEQKKWCCENRQLGCPTKPLFDCDAGYENWQMGWSEIKKTWCCDKVKKGCDRPICQPSNNDLPGGPKLFCASIIRPHGYEPKLMQAQLKKCVHIFNCDDWAVVSEETVWLSRAPQVTTLAFDSYEAKLATVAGARFNSDPFKKFWEVIKDDGRYKLNDWTVKADPDTVFFPDRLKSRLMNSKYMGQEPHFFANCGDSSYIVEPTRHMGKSWMYGALELISRTALTQLFSEVDTCEPGDTFEETWLTDCFRDIGIEMNREMDLNLLRDDDIRCSENPQGKICADDTVAMHNFSGIPQWFKCFEEATAEHKD